MNRIDPNHPFAVAARENDATAEALGFEAALDEIEIGDFDSLNYIVRQRAMRALAIYKGEEIKLGEPFVLAAEDAPLFNLLQTVSLDGITIGWRARQEQSVPFGVGKPAGSINPEVIS